VAGRLAIGVAGTPAAERPVAVGPLAPPAGSRAVREGALVSRVGDERVLDDAFREGSLRGIDGFDWFDLTSVGCGIAAPDRDEFQRCFLCRIDAEKRCDRFVREARTDCPAPAGP